MKSEEIKQIIAEHDAPNRYCCRCGSHNKEARAKIFRYKAFFCSDDCAERASDYALEYGQEVVPDYNNNLNEIQRVVLALPMNLRDVYNDNLWEYVTTGFDYDETYNMDRFANATAQERSAVLARTLMNYNKLKPKKKSKKV